MAEFKLGRFSKLYTSPDGTTFTEVANTRDVEVSAEWSTATMDHRGLNDSLVAPVVRDCTLTFSITRDVTDPTYLVLRDAFLAKTTLYVEACTNTRTVIGTEKFACEMVLITFSISEPLTEFDSVDITMKPSANYSTSGGITLTIVAA
jgi:hypothetical protein